jgi:hypothetical protein
MVKAVLERGLAAELTEHLGYERGDPAGRGSPNSRNGTTPKTLATEVGDVPPAVPRDATPPVACLLPCAQRTNAVDLLVDQQADLDVAGPCVRTEVSTRVAMSWAAASSGSKLFHSSGDCSRVIKSRVIREALRFAPALVSGGGQGY